MQVSLFTVTWKQSGLLYTVFHLVVYGIRNDTQSDKKRNKCLSTRDDYRIKFFLYTKIQRRVSLPCNVVSGMNRLGWLFISKTEKTYYVLCGIIHLLWCMSSNSEVLEQQFVVCFCLTTIIYIQIKNILGALMWDYRKMRYIIFATYHLVFSLQFDFWAFLKHHA